MKKHIVISFSLFLFFILSSPLCRAEETEIAIKEDESHTSLRGLNEGTESSISEDEGNESAHLTDLASSSSSSVTPLPESVDTSLSSVDASLSSVDSIDSSSSPPLEFIDSSLSSTSITEKEEGEVEVEEHNRLINEFEEEMLESDFEILEGESDDEEDEYEDEYEDEDGNESDDEQRALSIAEEFDMEILEGGEIDAYLEETEMLEMPRLLQEIKEEEDIESIKEEEDTDEIKEEEEIEEIDDMDEAIEGEIDLMDSEVRKLQGRYHGMGYQNPHHHHHHHGHGHGHGHYHYPRHYHGHYHRYPYYGSRYHHHHHGHHHHGHHH